MNYFFNGNIGVGFLTRCSAATMDYQNRIDRAEIERGNREPENLQTVTLDVGRLQILGGVRFRF